ncbi:hypothetical protein ACSRUE_16600 [Sorangium sp. KYC3313]|uniref:hypothetical protein n=1 Tax=Sorangium sp. KYC3313 TaxID=3449740 RepID=UPI003F89356C
MSAPSTATARARIDSYQPLTKRLLQRTLPGAHGAQLGPPQSTPDSAPFWIPSSQVSW